jgi:hypothetical protein
VPTRAELRSHLLTTRIAGEVATSRENNLANYRAMCAREPLYLFGQHLTGAWPFADVLELMARRCGVSPDPRHARGQDTIDVDRTLDRLDALGDRLREAVAARSRVLLATGHPVGLRPTHTAVAAGLAAAGCRIVRAAEGWAHPEDRDYRIGGARIRYVDGVAMMDHPSRGLVHTHSPHPMEAILAALDAAGEAPPDLVVADHGWAGAAGQAGIDVVGYADCNDPALFVGEAEGRVQVCVPLDDNLPPHLYAPLTAYLLDRAALTSAASRSET